ncbi:MAG: helix-turn-helix transcriptional regulator [Candidatus Hermodarchaeota archaeon]
MKNRIKELRARYNLTQEELAQKAEVTRQTISSLEKGRYDPSLKLAFRLARIFETQIEEVFLYEE